MQCDGTWNYPYPASVEYIHITHCVSGGLELAIPILACSMLIARASELACPSFSGVYIYIERDVWCD